MVVTSIDDERRQAGWRQLGRQARRRKVSGGQWQSREEEMRGGGRWRLSVGLQLAGGKDANIKGGEEAKRRRRWGLLLGEDRDECGGVQEGR